jgi:hypothetical protein
MKFLYLFLLIPSLLYMSCAPKAVSTPPDMPIQYDYENSLKNLNVSYQGDGGSMATIGVYSTGASYFFVVGAQYDTVLIDSTGEIYMYLLDPLQVAMLTMQGTIAMFVESTAKRTSVMWDRMYVNLNVYGELQDMSYCLVSLSNYWQFNTLIYRQWYDQLNVWLKDSNETALESFDPVLDVVWGNTNLQDPLYTRDGQYDYFLSFKLDSLPPDTANGSLEARQSTLTR